MRTAKLTLNGVEHLLCFSVRTVRAVSDRYGGLDKMNEAFSGGDTAKLLDESLWMLAAMMDAGDRYAKLNGLDNPPPVSYEDMYDLVGMDDLENLKGKVFETISIGRSTTVEVEPPKNAGAAQGKQSK